MLNFAFVICENVVEVSVIGEGFETRRGRVELLSQRVNERQHWARGETESRSSDRRKGTIELNFLLHVHSFHPEGIRLT